MPSDARMTGGGNEPQGACNGRRADGKETAIRVQQLRTQMQAIAEKIGDIESDADEHKYVVFEAYTRLVIKTLREVKEQDSERTCFRLVGGILVERTAKDVLPTLESTHDGVRNAIIYSSQLMRVLMDLAKQFKQNESELLELQRKVDT